MPPRSPRTAVPPPVTLDSDALTVLLPALAPSVSGRSRHGVQRILFGVLVLLSGLVSLGALLPAAPSTAPSTAPSATPSTVPPQPGPAPVAVVPQAPVTDVAPIPAAAPAAGTPRTAPPTGSRATAVPQAAAPRIIAPRAVESASARKPVARPSIAYANCDAVRAAGAAPIRREEPGYSAKLDRDNDGVGCES